MIDFARLKRIADEVDQLQAAQGLGKFDPGRQPNIVFPTQPWLCTALDAAVSPDCSYRLIEAAINESQSKLLVYVYEISADYLIDLLTKAKERGVGIRLMYDAGGTRKDAQETLQGLGFPVKPAPSSGGRSVFTVAPRGYGAGSIECVARKRLQRRALDRCHCRGRVSPTRRREW